MNFDVDNANNAVNNRNNSAYDVVTIEINISKNALSLSLSYAEHWFLSFASSCVDCEPS